MKILSLTFLLFPLLSLAGNDSQLWYTPSFSGKLAPSTTFKAMESFRWKDHMSEFRYSHTDLLVNYQMTDWLNLGLMYRHVVSMSVFPSGAKLWSVENRPGINAAASFGFSGFSLVNRGRLEMRFTPRLTFRYRHRITVKTPWKWTVLEINPVVFTEPFFDKTGFAFNWLNFGFNLKITDIIGANLGYLWVYNANGDCDHVANLATSLSF